MRRFYQAAMGSSAASGTVFIINEDFEAAGTPSGWGAQNGSPNFDYSAAPLEASQSLYCASASAAVRARVDFTDQVEIYVYFLVRFTNGSLPASGTPNFGGIAVNGGTTLQPSLTVTATSGIINYGPISTSGGISVNTTYHFWLHYKQGSGANSLMDVGFSTTGIRPTSGSNYAATTTGSNTNLAGRVFCGTNATTLGADLIFDKVRVATTQIGDNGV